MFLECKVKGDEINKNHTSGDEIWGAGTHSTSDLRDQVRSVKLSYSWIYASALRSLPQTRGTWIAFGVIPLIMLILPSYRITGEILLALFQYSLYEKSR